MASYSSLTDLIASAYATFARAGAGTYEDSTGAVVRFASGEPRLDDRGLLVEPAVTNLFAHGEMADATTGTVSGTPLSGVTVDGTQSGVVASIEAVGTTDGVSWMDYRLNGTNSSGSTLFFDIIDTTSQSASEGETAILDAWCALSGGSVPSGTSVTMYAHYRDSSSSLVGQSLVSVGGSLTSSLQRFAGGSAAPATTTQVVNKGLFVSVTDGTTVDMTLRVGNFQVTVDGAASYPEYVPTSGTVVTRPADALTVLPAAGTYDITVTFDDDSMQLLSGEAVTGAGWAVPTTLDSPYVKSVDGAPA